MCDSDKYFPDLEQFRQMSQRGNLIPIYKTILADLETPVSAFYKIRSGDYDFLLESVEGGERLARYSFLGKDPFMVIRSNAGRVLIERAEGVEEREEGAVPATGHRPAER